MKTKIQMIPPTLRRRLAMPEYRNYQRLVHRPFRVTVRLRHQRMQQQGMSIFQNQLLPSLVLSFKYNTLAKYATRGIGTCTRSQFIIFYLWFSLYCFFNNTFLTFRLFCAPKTCDTVYNIVVILFHELVSVLFNQWEFFELGLFGTAEKPSD